MVEICLSTSISVSFVWGANQVTGSFRIGEMFLNCGYHGSKLGLRYWTEIGEAERRSEIVESSTTASIGAARRWLHEGFVWLKSVLQLQFRCHSCGIHLYINSLGSVVTAGLAIYDTMQVWLRCVFLFGTCLGVFLIVSMSLDCFNVSPL